MMHPDFDEFERLSEKGNLIPVYKEILADTETPVSAFMKLSHSASFLFESVEGGEKWARYSFIGVTPSRVITGKGNKVRIVDEAGRVEEVFADDPLDVLKAELERYRPVTLPDLPRFCGGLVGYIGYDSVRFIERLPDYRKQGVDMPDIFFMLADTIVVFDSLKQKIKVVTNVFTDDRELSDAYSQAVEKVENVVDKLRGGHIRPPADKSPNRGADGEFTSSFSSRDDFLRAVEKAKRYVTAGDVVQVVVSQRFERECSADAFDIYRSLRVVNPSPYMYFIDTGVGRIIGSSPEILVRVEDKEIVLRPIAGTRRRGRSDGDDMEMENELKSDPKERAEHIMLVDLGRNDVGRVAEIGSVEVTELMAVERYSHVMHLVSHVTGKLGNGKDVFDVIRACFPAGTVTGAPKIRAMEIIEELEPVKRGPYAGAVGYIGFSGSMDMCITIRTLLYKDDRIYIQAGAGIVADSDPRLEYKETVHKAMGMRKAVEMAEEGIE